MIRKTGPEISAAALCALLTLVPVLRVPAGFALLCLVPGIAIARRWLGVSSFPRLFILGSLLSLAAVPAVAIPASLVAGRPSVPLAVLSAAAITVLAVTTGRARGDGAGSPLIPRHLILLAATALAMQIGMSMAKHPDTDTIRWKGLPDLMFFNGIYTQLTLHTPPLDPENGAGLLVHNWIYHFHFALLKIVTGLGLAGMERLVSAWLALALLGLVYLLAADVMRKPAAGLWACLLLMTSGEIYWVVRSAVELSLSARPLPWVHSPFGVTILFGWYNLAPLCAGLGAWYWLERHRAAAPDRRAAPLAASVAMCCVTAFFHPVFYGVFMIGFCLWLAWLAWREGLHPAWLSYLATPIPFFLFYKVPYYGMAMPPRVVHPDFSPGSVITQAIDLTYAAGLYVVPGLIGVAVSRGTIGPAPFILAASVALRILVRAPNPHWFNDLLHVTGAMASGAGLAWLSERWPARGAAVVAACLLVAAVSFGLHLPEVLSVKHTFTEDEKEAAAWLRSRTSPDDLVVILPNSSSSFTVLGLAQRRLVHGWTGHLLDFHSDARVQEQEVVELFTTPEPARANELATRLQAAYIYIGEPERAALGPASLPHACFPVVFPGRTVELRRFTCEATPAPLPAGGS